MERTDVIRHHPRNALLTGVGLLAIAFGMFVLQDSGNLVSLSLVAVACVGISLAVALLVAEARRTGHGAAKPSRSRSLATFALCTFVFAVIYLALTPPLFFAIFWINWT